MPYLKEIGMIPDNAQAKGITVMKILDLNKEFGKSKHSPVTAATFFAHTSVLQAVLYSK